MWICFIYTIKERCKLCVDMIFIYIQLRKGVSYTIVDMCFIYTIKERCKLCGYVLYIQLMKGVSCVDMFYIYN